MKGSGLFIRDSNINPPKVRSLLKRVGNEPVKSILLIRTPLAPLTKLALELTGADLNKAMKQSNIDELYHLSMLINGKYELDKSAVIGFRSSGNAVKSNSNTLQVKVPSGLTINELFDKTIKRMKDRYGNYDAKTNNCSVFIKNILDANKLSTSASNTFVIQDTNRLFSRFPSLTEIVAKVATTAGAVIDRQKQGEGSVWGGRPPPRASTGATGPANNGVRFENNVQLQYVYNGVSYLRGTGPLAHIQW